MRRLNFVVAILDENPLADVIGTYCFPDKARSRLTSHEKREAYPLNSTFQSSASLCPTQLRMDTQAMLTRVNRRTQHVCAIGENHFFGPPRDVFRPVNRTSVHVFLLVRECRQSSAWHDRWVSVCLGRKCSSNPFDNISAVPLPHRL